MNTIVSAKVDGASVLIRGYVMGLTEEQVVELKTIPMTQEKYQELQRVIRWHKERLQGIDTFGSC